MAGPPIELAPRVAVSAAFDPTATSARTDATKLDALSSAPITSRIESPPLLTGWAARGAVGSADNFAAAYDGDQLALAADDDVRRLAGVGAGAVAARWRGYLSAPITEPYTLTLVVRGTGARAANRGRLFLNGELVVAVEAPGRRTDTNKTSAPILLKEGTLNLLTVSP
jgi:hypothetical protein